MACSSRESPSLSSFQLHGDAMTWPASCFALLFITSERLQKYGERMWAVLEKRNCAHALERGGSAHRKA